MSAKISVIMPVYNCERYLEAAVESVLSQEGVEVELIAVEDCSTDASRDILCRLAQNDTRIRAVLNEQNMGVAAVRNRALDLVTGDFVAFCDSDDTVPAGAYAAMAAAVGDKDLAIGEFENFYYEGDELIRTEHCDIDSEAPSSDFLALFSVCCLWTKLIRTSFLKKHGFRFDEGMHIGEDVVFLGGVATVHPTYALVYTSVYRHCHYRMSDYHSLTHVYTLEAYKKHVECRQKLLEICREIPICRDYVYLRFSGDVGRYLYLLTSDEDRFEAFELFRAYMLGYDYAEKPLLFKATVGMDFEAFRTVSAARFFEYQREIPARERVAAEFDSGMIGLRWIWRFFKGWLRFKLKRSYK